MRVSSILRKFVRLDIYPNSGCGVYPEKITSCIPRLLLANNQGSKVPTTQSTKRDNHSLDETINHSAVDAAKPDAREILSELLNLEMREISLMGNRFVFFETKEFCDAFENGKCTDLPRYIYSNCETEIKTPKGVLSPADFAFVVNVHKLKQFSPLDNGDTQSPSGISGPDDSKSSLQAPEPSVSETPNSNKSVSPQLDKQSVQEKPVARSTLNVHKHISRFMSEHGDPMIYMRMRAHYKKSVSPAFHNLPVYVQKWWKYTGGEPGACLDVPELYCRRAVDLLRAKRIRLLRTKELLEAKAMGIRVSNAEKDKPLFSSQSNSPDDLARQDRLIRKQNGILPLKGAVPKPSREDWEQFFG